MIEIRMSNQPEHRNRYQLLINGALVDKAKVECHVEGFGKRRFGLVVLDQEIGEQLNAHRLSDLPPLEYLKLQYKFDGLELLDYIWISRPYNEQLFEISFNFEPNLQEWNRTYSFAEYFLALSHLVEMASYFNAESNLHDKDEGLIHGFHVNFPFSSPQSSIAEEVARCFNILCSFHEKAEKFLTLQQRNDSISFFFKFPEEVKVPCEQYLLYFVQFLRDLGVDATSELKHEVEQVLFTVTPTNAPEALGKIRTALEIYLCLPSSRIGDNSEVEKDIAIQRLIGNIYHLKSQLALSLALLQAKDATIETQHVTLDYQQRLLSGKILIESLSDVPPRLASKDREELWKGKIAITRYEGKGFEINLAEIIRWLKQIFTSKK